MDCRDCHGYRKPILIGHDPEPFHAMFQIQGGHHALPFGNGVRAMMGIVSRETVAALEPEGKPVFLWDEVISGFGVKLSASGRRTFIFQYRPRKAGGAARRLTIGIDGQDCDADEARRIAAPLRAAVLAGEEPRKLPAFGRRPVETAPKERPSADRDWPVRLGYAIADVARFQQAAIRRTIDSFGGSHAQWRVLGRLSIEQGLTQSELAAKLNLGKVAVSGLIQRAIKAGWVETRAVPNDRRARHLFLTPRARQAAMMMRAELNAIYARAFSDFTEADGLHLLDMVQKLADAMLPLAKPNLTPDGEGEFGD
jgi:DNA-binding MarR family transcriptional regulator